VKQGCRFTTESAFDQGRGGGGTTERGNKIIKKPPKGLKIRPEFRAR